MNRFISERQPHNLNPLISTSEQRQKSHKKEKILALHSQEIINDLPRVNEIWVIMEGVEVSQVAQW